MVFQVQVFVFHPYWLPQLVAQPLVERRCHLKFLPQLVRQLCHVIIRRALGKREQLQATHVHGLLAFFQPEKELVGGAQGFHVGTFWQLVIETRVDSTRVACRVN